MELVIIKGGCGNTEIGGKEDGKRKKGDR